MKVNRRSATRSGEEARAKINRSTPVDALPEFLSPEEFWTYLGLGRATCYELVRRGEIPSIRFGHVIRIPKSALQRGDQP